MYLYLVSTMYHIYSSIIYYILQLYFASYPTPLPPPGPLVDLVHAVLEESEVWLVPGLQSLHLVTAQLSHVFLISPVSYM